MTYKDNSLQFLTVFLTVCLITFLSSSVFCKESSLQEGIIQSLSRRGIHPLWVVFIISMLPIFELRGGIPVGINLFHLHWFVVIPIAILGNMVPVAPILVFLGPLARFLSRIKFLKVFFDWLFKHTRSKSKIVEKYKSIGLMLFVAIPLPVTGAWTGSIAAFLFNVKFHNAIISILFGVCIAAVIVTTLSMLGIWGAIIAGTVLIALAVLSMLGSIR